jgi:cytochrome c oxidase assembly protein subunit 11
MAQTAARKNRFLMFALVAVVAAMVGGSYAAVPLYRIFCQVTGFGGTTNVAEKPSETISDRVMTIRFDATVNGVPWSFQPVRRAIRTRVGESTVAFYRAENRGSEPVTGSATFNVTPLKAGQYFSKIECFCFTEQRLEPGQSADMPVTFFVDPAIEDDRNLDDVTTITLSYTFYPVEEEQDNPKSVSRRSVEKPTGNATDDTGRRGGAGTFGDET